MESGVFERRETLRQTGSRFSRAFALLVAFAAATLAGATRSAYAQSVATAPQLRPPFSGPTVQLLTDHRKSTRLQQQSGPTWTDVCASPCGLAVDPNAVYRLAGVALSPTDPFQLPRSSGAVRITASMSSKAMHHTGVALSISGGATALISLVSLLSVDESKPKGTTAFFSVPDPALTFGVITAIMAGLLLVVGLPLASVHSTADIE